MRVLERHARDVEAAGDGAHLLVGELVDAADGLVDSSHNHVLQHIDVLGIERIGVNSEVDELHLAVDSHLDHAAAGRGVDGLGLEVLLRGGKLLLHLASLLHHLLHGVKLLDKPVNEDAAADWINQAEALSDGERIYVPTQEEAEESAQSVSGQWADPNGNAGGSVSDKININTAAKEELMTLSGIGASKAESILKYRQEHGNFQSIEDLKKIEGIKDGVFNKIKDDITV